MILFGLFSWILTQSVYPLHVQVCTHTVYTITMPCTHKQCAAKIPCQRRDFVWKMSDIIFVNFLVDKLTVIQFNTIA